MAPTYAVPGLFLVGAFPLREKCSTIDVTVFSRRFSREKRPTLTVASFLFFSSDYNLTLIGPLFLQSKLLKLLA